MTVRRSNQPTDRPTNGVIGKIHFQNRDVKVVMNPTKLPVSLLQERAKYARVHMLDTEPFAKTFGKNATRKRPNMKVADLESLAATAESRGDSYDDTKVF